MPPMAIWGGIECTVNRVRNEWFDQLVRSGHDRRTLDLDVIAALGIKTLRYPILWERTVKSVGGVPDWSWSDERLGRLRRLGITPIVGLIHHGSGPAGTDLVDPGFPHALADFAQAVAKRYPWVEYYTPVNEPLTTARFSGLYGHWYPHAKSTRAFVAALINQCKATCLAMQAIRRVTSDAKLIQTEDLGTTFSTPVLRYQADFDNERRWLTWDLLCGRVTRVHPLRDYLLDSGLDPAVLDELAGTPCPPDVLGVNHYVTSDRFLHEDLDRFPSSSHGGNQLQRYADVEAVRVLDGSYRGWDVLDVAWNRYRIPLALTEVHLGGTREEQVRWLLAAHSAALDARARGCQITALTVWALLGSFDWNSLLTRVSQHYEPGAFDCRSRTPRPTALAHAIRRLCGRTHDAPSVVETGRGWWELPHKHCHGIRLRDPSPTHFRHARSTPTPPLLILGSGTLGTALEHACNGRNLRCTLLSRSELDISDAAAVESAIRSYKPWAVINAAGYVRVDDAEHDPVACFRANTTGVEILGRLSADNRLPLLTFSSDLVFDGTVRQPYVESSPVHPLGVYGRSKAAAEQLLSSTNPDALCVRSSAFFGYWGTSDFLARALQALAQGHRFVALEDVVVSPTYIPDLVTAALDLLLDRESGIWHLANAGALSWSAFTRAAASLGGLEIAGLESLSQAQLSLPARRPAYSVLGSERGQLLPCLEDALGRCLATAPPHLLQNQRLT